MPDADAPRPLTEAQRWIQLREDVADCRRCRLSQTRTHTVFGRGTPQQARWLLIGEAPGAEEDPAGAADASAPAADPVIAVAATTPAVAKPALLTLPVTGASLIGGVVALIAIVAGLVLLFLRRRRR